MKKDKKKQWEKPEVREEKTMNQLNLSGCGKGWASTIEACCPKRGSIAS